MQHNEIRLNLAVDESIHKYDLTLKRYLLSPAVLMYLKSYFICVFFMSLDWLFNYALFIELLAVDVLLKPVWLW